MKAWQGLAINNVVGISQRTEFGENDSTSFVLSEEYNVLLSTGMGVSALDYRLSGFNFGIGISRNETESTGWGTDRTDRVFTTNFEKFGDKLRFATEMAYHDFVVHALGDLTGQCEAFKAFEGIAREPGFDSFANLLEARLNRSAPQSQFEITGVESAVAH